MPNSYLDSNGLKHYTDKLLENIQSNASGVTSFNGRTGAITPQSGDYTAAMVSAVPTSRTVNGKALSQNISLNAKDIGIIANGNLIRISGAASGNNCIAIGYDATSSGNNSIAIGYECSTLYNNSIAIGTNVSAKANVMNACSIGIGFNVNAAPHLGHGIAIGNDLLVGTEGISIGFNSKPVDGNSSTTYSIALGYNTLAGGVTPFPLGKVLQELGRGRLRSGQLQRRMPH